MILQRDSTVASNLPELAEPVVTVMAHIEPMQQRSCFTQGWPMDWSNCQRFRPIRIGLRGSRTSVLCSCLAENTDVGVFVQQHPSAFEHHNPIEKLNRSQKGSVVVLWFGSLAAGEFVAGSFARELSCPTCLQPFKH